MRYRTIPAAGTLDYFRGVLALPAGDGPKQLAHYLRHLEHVRPEVAEDAYLELSRSSSRHLRAAARGFPADRVAGWLRDLKVPAYRQVTYALLLAHCGDASHGKQVRELLDAARKTRSPNLDQFLIAHVLVQPGEGWEYLDGILSDPRQDLPTRQAALQAVRFFWYERDDLLPRAPDPARDGVGSESDAVIGGGAGSTGSEGSSANDALVGGATGGAGG